VSLMLSIPAAAVAVIQLIVAITSILHRAAQRHTPQIAPKLFCRDASQKRPQNESGGANTCAAAS